MASDIYTDFPEILSKAQSSSKFTIQSAQLTYAVDRDVRQEGEGTIRARFREDPVSAAESNLPQKKTLSTLVLCLNQELGDELKLLAAILLRNYLAGRVSALS